MKNTSTTSKLSAQATVALALAVAALAGCRGDRDDKPPRQFFPDMDDMPRWQVQSQSDFFEDGRTMRQQVPNTVPFSRSPMSETMLAGTGEWSKPFASDRQDLLKDNPVYATGKNADGSFVASIPAEVTKDMLLLGQKKYNIYCVACHGYEGDGLGIVGDTTKGRAFSWSYAIPSYHDVKYRSQDPADAKSQKHTDGFLFDTARNGVIDPTGAQKMPGYKHALSERDSWAVVAYIRALQRARLGTAGDLPEATRQALDAAPANSAAPANATPTTGGKP
jgi:mono/diheme cytochrome c family protein